MRTAAKLGLLGSLYFSQGLPHAGRALGLDVRDLRTDPLKP